MSHVAHIIETVVFFFSRIDVETQIRSDPIGTAADPLANLANTEDAVEVAMTSTQPAVGLADQLRSHL